MLFTTINQFGIFLSFVWLGAILKTFYDIFKPNNSITKNVYDCIYYVCSGALFIVFMHIYNLGQFRLYLLLGIIIGMLITKTFISKTLAELNKLLYNYIYNKYNKFKTLLKTKDKQNNNEKTTSKNKKSKKSFSLNNQTKNKKHKFMKKFSKISNKNQISKV